MPQPAKPRKQRVRIQVELTADLRRWVELHGGSAFVRELLERQKQVERAVLSCNVSTIKNKTR